MRTCCWLLVFAAIMVSGCSGTPPVQSVSGSVKLDGEPLGGVAVQFWHENNMEEPYGTIETAEDGSFILEPNQEFRRWRTGTYFVRVIDRAAIKSYFDNQKDPTVRVLAHRVPEKYGSPQTTPLEVTIGAGEPVINLALESQ